MDKTSSKVVYGLPYGTYVVKEFKAPDGYVKSDKEYEVTFNDNNLTDEVVITNEEENITSSHFILF